jgi:hypothetical protein
MKATKRVVLIILFLGITVILVGGVGMGASRYLASNKKSPISSCTSTNGSKLNVTIKNDTAIPVHIDAKQCDVLTITNADPVDRLIAFGPHDDHISYDGIKEKLLKQNDSLTIKLDQVGNFRFHDHENDNVISTFTVTY